ncbi:MAG: hypothetical protein FWB84_08270 [Candidatus Bathyarchaeota archaeon]|uniref:hypothetical protein n=1 Tax=Candidatus Bathycorpusculum sp. TaxID=2994959 RepID=UPI0028313B6C|nr:hypothetical protein [Candidatus Termiticorpusculum sp.]MCL2256807.1 hypothetical protein [Candidatus Termiticorpusculum sp.]
MQCLNQAATSSGDTQSRAADVASINASSLLALSLRKTPFIYAHINSIGLKTGESEKKHLLLG